MIEDTPKSSTMYERLEGLHLKTRLKGRYTCERQILKGKHVLVIGTTGSGKTYFATRFAEKYYDCFLFVNTSLEDQVTKICQIIIQKLKL